MQLGFFEDWGGGTWGDEWIADVPASEIMMPPESIFIPQQGDGGGFFDRILSAGERILPKLVNQQPASAPRYIPRSGGILPPASNTTMKVALGAGALGLTFLLVRSIAK